MRGRGSNTIVKIRLLITTHEDMKEDEEVKEGSRVVWLGKYYSDWALRLERVYVIFEEDSVTVYGVYETLS